MITAHVYQLDKQPIPDKARLTASMADGTLFRRDIARHVYPSPSPQADADLLIARLTEKGGVAISKDSEGRIQSIVFGQDFQYRYFDGRYSDFITELFELEIRFTEYRSVRPGTMFDALLQAYTNTYDDYVYECGEFVPLDDFVRTIDADTAYYLGGILRYDAERPCATSK